MKKSLRMKIMLLLFALVVGMGNVWADDDKYVKITSSSDLVADAEYLLVSGTEAYSGISSNSGTHVTVEFNSDGEITDISDAHVLKLGGSSGAWTFYDETDEKYIAYTQTATSGSSYNRLYQVSNSTDNGATWTLSVTSSAVSFKNNYNTGRWIRYNTTSDGYFRCYYNANSESTTGNAVTLYKKDAGGGDDPTIIVDADNLKDFAFATNDGPSMPQSITVSGSNLDENISLGLGNNSQFEISLSANSGWGSSIELEESEGAVSETTIYVRMKNSNSDGTPSGTLTLESGETSESVDLTGHVVTPWTVAEARTAIDQANNHNVSNAYVKGIVSESNYYSNNNHYITYFISDNGENTNTLESFHGMNIYGSDFAALTDVQVGDEVLIFGNLTLYSTTYEFAEGNYLLTHKKIRVNKTELTNYTYIAGNGPSAAQTFTVTGANLTSNLSLSLNQNSNFEMSLSENSDYTNTLSFTPSAGSVSSQTIYVRMKSGLSKGNYNGTITLTSTGNDFKSISLSGTVTAQTYTLTDESGANGSISFSASPVEAGTHVVLTPAPVSAAYYFVEDSWSFFKDNLDDVTDEIEFVPEETNTIIMPSYNLHVDATFTAKPTYAITCVASPVAGGEIEADPASAYEGQTVTLTYMAETDYTLSSIVITKTSDGSATGITPTASGDNFTFTMPAYAVTVTATFVPVYHVSYNANLDGATGSTTDATDYKEGDEATVLACGFSKTGYAFSHWNTATNDSGVSYDAGDKITIGTANITLYAQWVEVSSVTYTIGSTTSVTPSGTEPLGSVAIYSQTHSTAGQMTKDNSITLSVKGCQGRTVKSIVLNMKSNSGSGSGNMTAKAGTTTLASISTAAFNTASWYGAWSTSYVDIEPTMSNANYELKSNEDIVITIAATANSLYCNSFTITYATTTKDPMVFTLPSSQVVTNAEQEISTSDDEAFGIASLNIATPSYSIAYCDEDGNVLGSNPYSWFTPSISSSKVVYSVEENTEDTDRIAYFKVYATVSATKYYSALCSVTQKHQPFTYTLVDGTDVKLEAGKRYIIASSKSDGKYAAMGRQNGSIRDTVHVKISSKKFTEVDGLYEVVISGSGTDAEPWTMYSVKDAGYMYATGGSSANIGIRTDNITTNPTYGQWTISISDDVASITCKASIDYKYFMFNGNRFACYKNAQSSVYLYKRDNDKDLEFYSPTTIASATIAADETYTVESGQILNIATLTNNGTAASLIIEPGAQLFTNSAVPATIKQSIASATSKDDVFGWYTISSPVADVNITDNTNLISNTYNLLRYNETGRVWENYGNDAHNSFDNTLEEGRGYLYRNSEDITLEYSGTINNNTVEYNVTNNGGELAGFNLIGNPYTHDIYKGASGAVPNTGASGYVLASGFYTLTKEGEWHAGDDNEDAIKSGQGFLVKATTDGIITMSNVMTGGPSKSRANHDNIKFIVENNQYSDVAYAVFDKGISLNKINHRNPNSPMLYIPQAGDKYALAMMSDETRAFNLNFKAMSMGQYTLSLKANGEFDYIHIIDLLTGEDVDMLLEGKYTFIGTPSDSDNRFIVKLAYNSGNTSSIDESFAYQSGSDIHVTGSGELQIFDVTGRMVMTTTVNGAETINLSVQGVYIFRLIGTEIKTQKIVVR